MTESDLSGAVCRRARYFLLFGTWTSKMSESGSPPAFAKPFPPVAELAPLADDVAALMPTLATLQRRTTSDSFYSAGMGTCMPTCKTRFHMVVLL